MKWCRATRVTAAMVVTTVAAVLLLAGSGSAVMDVAGWHFQDLSSHQIPIGFGAAFDSEKVAWVRYDGQQSDVFLLDIDSSSETRVTNTPESESEGALDGDRLVGVSREGWEIDIPAEVWLRDLQTGT